MKKAISILIIFASVLGILCSCSVTSKKSKCQIDFLNVGKADCIVIQTEGKVVMIDTGYDNKDEIIFDYLDGQEIKTIDYLIITHYDKDHTGGTKDLFANYTIKNVYYPDYVGTTNKYLEFQDCLEEYDLGKHLVTSDIVVELSSNCTITINPTKLTNVEDENNYSLIVSFVHQNYRALFLGDALKDRIDEYLKLDKSKYKLVKLPHHGDYFKKLEELLQSTKPASAVMTIDEVEEPVEENTIEMCSDLGIRLFRTDNGMVRVLYNYEEGTSTISYCE